MTDKKLNSESGYKPKSLSEVGLEGYQPTKAELQSFQRSVKGGYSPTSSGNNPTSNPKPPGKK